MPDNTQCTLQKPRIAQASISKLQKVILLLILYNNFIGNTVEEGGKSNSDQSRRCEFSKILIQSYTIQADTAVGVIQESGLISFIQNRENLYIYIYM